MPNGCPSRTLSPRASVDPVGTLVGVDVLGGQFSWAQASPDALPTIHYFGPDTLDWQDLKRGYTDWLYSALTGSLEQFYESLRWPGWAAEVEACPLNQGIHTSPPPWTVEGKDLATASRKPISMTELTNLYTGTTWQLD